MRKLILGAAAGFAAIALSVAGTTAASATVRPNATPACGSNCQDFSSLLLGRGTILNAYVSGDTGVAPAKPGQDVNFNLASNERPNEDWQYEAVGFVGQFCQSGLNPAGPLAATSVACIDFRHFPAFELNWAPWGNQSGYCAGTTGATVAGQNVKLVACGTTAGSILIVDTAHVKLAHGHLYAPAISGATTLFSHPYVFTTDPGTTKPINQLKLRQENLLTGNVAQDSQEFTYVNGPAA
jgi:hypothetical protein